MDFKEWLKTEESCGTMGCPGRRHKDQDTPTGRASKRYPKYKLDNKGCSGTLGPCASGESGAGGGGAAAAAPPSKMKKR